MPALARTWKARLTDRLVETWYRPQLSLAAILLWPLGQLMRIGVALRTYAYRRGLLRAVRLPVPVIVIGNISVGGTGKTPLAIALVHALVERGYRPGVVSRGYGRAAAATAIVTPDAQAEDVGDEPLLMARAGLTVAVGVDRVAAARALLARHPECDVLIADDGLQHLQLAREVEIAVVDAVRGLGNGQLLPAGPLREPPSRLAHVDAVVVNGTGAAPLPRSPQMFRMRLEGAIFRQVAPPHGTCAARAFTGPDIHAVAGIGHPARFFAQLAALGIAPSCHAFPDHHRFAREDFAFPGARAVLMTEKDAVKCEAFADPHWWSLPVTASLDPALVTRVLRVLPAPRS